VRCALCGSHRHYSNPFRPTASSPSPDIRVMFPRGIIADIIEDLGLSRDDFYFKKF
jgi:hypothetical protein